MKKPILKVALLADIPSEEAWLFKLENKKVLKRLKESLQQRATIDLGTFKKYLN